MPEYLAPGVYVEETSFRSKSIEGVSTSTTAFVGPTRKGPLTDTPEVITSFGEFMRMYGGLENLSFTTDTDTTVQKPNYMAHAVHAFFNNGGRRLYIGRTFTPLASGEVASCSIFSDTFGEEAHFEARFPGSALNGQIRVYEKKTPATMVTLNNAPEGSLLCIVDSLGSYYYEKRDSRWEDSMDNELDMSDYENGQLVGNLITVNLEAEDSDNNVILYEDLGFGEEHPRFLGKVLAENPSKRSDALQNPYFLSITDSVTAFDLHSNLLDGETENSFRLTGGNDGTEPDKTSYKEALDLLEQIQDISIIAAPGHSDFTSFEEVQLELISHAERLRYRVAILDTPQDATISEARQIRSGIDSKYAALYYPWIIVANPLAKPANEQIKRELALPPSGFMAGIYARNDNERGVWKAPANEVVRGALRFEREITHGQQEVLNPEGINCLRSFYGRGNRVWGARTVSSDPEWKYLNVRRYFIYVEHSIDRSTQWVVFESNGPRLWANIIETISDFLDNEWRIGALLGVKPEEAYFVRCDRSTMTQADLDNGRLICEIGIAVLKPAEFVIFRVGQWTADARS